MAQALPPAHWPPRDPREALAGFGWLGRMLDKGRREALGLDLEDFWVFEGSPADMMFLQAWKVSPDQVRGWLAEGLDAEAVAQRFAESAGQPSAEARAADKRRREWVFAPIFWGMDAQEGRLPEGLGKQLALAMSRVTQLVGGLIRGGR